MITILKLIIRDIFSNKYKFIILLILNAMIVSFFAQSVLLMDFGYEKINSANSLRTSNIYSVNLFNTTDNIELFKSDVLSNLITKNQIYLSSNEGVVIKNYDYIPVMMIVSNTIEIDDLVYEGGNAYVGSKVSEFDEGNIISLSTFPKELEFSISKALPLNSLMISGNQIFDLDDYIIIVVDPIYFLNYLNLYYGQDYSINYYGDSIGVKEVVESIGTNNIISYIDDPLKATSNYYAIMLKRNMQYMIVSFIMLILAVVGISISIHQITRNNINEYMIHHLFGSTKNKIYVRIISFGLIISVVSYIPIIISWSLQSMFIKTDIIVFSLSAMFIISVLVICLTPIKYLYNQDLTEFFKKEID